MNNRKKNNYIFVIIKVMFISFILNFQFSTISLANSVSNEFDQLLYQKSQGLQVSSTNSQITENIIKSNKEQNAAHVALVYFYEASCPHCQRFSPVMRTFVDQTKIPVYSFTVDGQTLPDWPRSAPADHDLLVSFFGESPVYLPAVFLVNEDNLQVPPVLIGTGEMTMTDLNEQINRQLNRMGL